LLPVLDKIVSLGPDSIKIEGRMKTESYVSLVTWVYRKALDLIREDKFDKKSKDMLLEELDKASHRNFTTGFMFAKGTRELDDNDNVGYIKKYTFIGTPEGSQEENGQSVIMVRNQFNKGDDIDILQPASDPVIRKAEEIIKVPGMDAIETANPNDRVIVKGIGELSPFSILRKNCN
jgi:putative protease